MAITRRTTASGVSASSSSVGYGNSPEQLEPFPQLLPRDCRLIFTAFFLPPKHATPGLNGICVLPGSDQLHTIELFTYYQPCTGNPFNPHGHHYPHHGERRQRLDPQRRQFDRLEGMRDELLTDENFLIARTHLATARFWVSILKPTSKTRHQTNLALVLH